MKVNQSQINPWSWIKGDQQQTKQTGLVKKTEQDSVSTLFAANNVKPTKQELEVAQSFVGEDKSKLKTLEVAIQKGVDITGENLEAMHEALTEPVNETALEGVSLATQESVLDAEVQQLIQKFPELKEVFAKLEAEHPELMEAVSKFIQTTSMKPSQMKDVLVKMSNILSNTDNVVVPETLERMVTSIMIEALESVEATVDLTAIESNTTGNLLDLLPTDKGDSDVTIAGKSYTKEDIEAMTDQEFSAVLKEALDELEVSVSALSQVVEHVSGIKLMVREEITQSMIDIKNTFNETKKAVNFIATQLEQNPRPQVVGGAIEKIAEKIENLITKTDLTLYTSMKEEKELLVMTHDLKNAQIEVQKGNIPKAKAMLKEVVGKLNKMNFAPKKQAIVAMMTKRFEEVIEPNPFKPSNIAKGFDYQQGRTKQVINVLKDMGINHESEIAERLDHPLKRDQEHPMRDNLKSVLMKLENANANQQVVKDISKMMNHLEGQQLLNHMPDDKDKLIQSFMVPYQSQGEMRELQVMINGKKNKFRIDDDNCSMYFAFDLKNHGEVGVLLSIKDDQISMTIKTDDQALGKSMVPLAQTMVENQKEFGFKVGRVDVKPLSDESKPKLEEAKRGVNTRENGGMDVKI